MTAKKPDSDVIAEALSEDFLRDTEDLGCNESAAMKILDINEQYHSFMNKISSGAFDYSNFARTLIEDDIASNDLILSDAELTQQGLRAPMDDLPLNNRAMSANADVSDVPPHVQTGNKWHPCTNMGLPSLTGQGYDQHRGNYILLINNPLSQNLRRPQMRQVISPSHIIAQRSGLTFQSYRAR